MQLARWPSGYLPGLQPRRSEFDTGCRHIFFSVIFFFLQKHQQNMHLKAHKQPWYSTSAHNVLGSMNKSAVLCTLMFDGRSLNNENTNLFLASVDQNHFYFNSPSMYSYPVGMQKK